MASVSEVILKGTTQPDFRYTYKISGTIDASTDIGKAITFDSATANTVKLAGDGDLIIGSLFSYEDRTVEGVKLATIDTKGGMALPKEASVTIALGATVVGAGSGLVKSGTASAANFVTEVESTTSVIVMFN